MMLARLSALSITLISGVPILAQQTPAARQQRIVVPRHRIYDHVFRQIVALENAADAADLKGDHSKANGYRKHFGNKIGLKDPETLALKNHAKACGQQVREQDARAAAIIQRERARFPGGRIPKGQPRPVAPSELDTMQDARNKMIEAHVEGLKYDLGPATFSKLDQFAHNHYAAVKVKPIVPPQRPAGARP